MAILARGCEPILTRAELPGDGADAESRYIEAAVRGVLVTSLYAPNGNPQPGPKFTYKLAWMKRLAAHAQELYRAGIPVVLAGDFNVVPTDRDIYPTTSYAKNALLQPQSRALFRRLLDQGWIDAIRARYRRDDDNRHAQRMRIRKPIARQVARRRRADGERRLRSPGPVSHRHTPGAGYPASAESQTVAQREA